jgi:hypothetical protein
LSGREKWERKEGSKRGRRNSSKIKKPKGIENPRKLRCELENRIKIDHK